MRKNKYMRESSMRGIVLSLVLLLTIMIIPIHVHAEEMVITSSSSSVESTDSDGDGILDDVDVCPNDPTDNCMPSETVTTSSSSVVEDAGLLSINAKSHSFEETTIIEFTNSGKKDVSSFMIWLNSDSNFKSFKTERSWIGEKTPQGVIVLTSSESVKSGESIKIGIKTDIPNPEINWKALDKNNEEIQRGTAVLEELVKPTPTLKNLSVGILEDSVYRVIPEKPNAGSTIRITGNSFGPSNQFEFYIDTNKIGTFQTDENGYFMATMKIPENQSQERSDFIVKDLEGNEKKISIRIGTLGTNIPTSDNVQLTIRGVPEIIQIGDMLKVSGTASPNSAVTATISNPDNEIINTRTAQVDAKGNWELEPILVALDSKLGRYSAEISDGREKISKSWVIESSKVIIITPLKMKFDSGETIKFNGTALPNIPLDLSLEDPLGVEKFSDVIEVDDSGIVNFEYPTIANVDKEGTWTLIAVQGDNKELIYAGLGQLPTIPINIEFDKLMYKTTDTAVISLTGVPGDPVSMLIVDPADKPKGESIPIIIEDDGKTTYSLPLKGYTSGIYTAVISKGNSKSTETFAVGLQAGSGEIKISTTKLEYSPNDPLLILGESNENVIIIISLFDSTGKKIKEIETFSDKQGKISEDGFRIPSEGAPGKWKINAKSGSNFKTIEINVNAAKEEGMKVSVDEGVKKSETLGKYIDIKVINAAQTVEIQILGPDGELVAELAFPASGSGEVKLPWAIPPDLIPGNYTITAVDGHNYAETTFLVPKS
jgi:hypothetical protein